MHRILQVENVQIGFCLNLVIYSDLDVCSMHISAGRLLTAMH